MKPFKEFMLEGSITHIINSDITLPGYKAGDKQKILGKGTAVKLVHYISDHRGSEYEILAGKNKGLVIQIDSDFLNPV